MEEDGQAESVCRPDSEDALARHVAQASGPLRIVGGGTRPVGHTRGAALSVAGLSGIVFYEPGALTMIARAGTPLSEIEARLAGEGQALAFEPPDWRGLLATAGEPTIGAVFATNASGPRRIAAGAARDHCLGVRFVDGSGAIISNGGRVMKNVTGYDLVRLMCGSRGTLGILTEISFKVLPRPKSAAVVLIEGLRAEAAIKVMSAALGSALEVSGAAHTPAGVDGKPVTMLRLEGRNPHPRERAGALAKVIGAPDSSITIETNPDHIAAGWRWVRNIEPFHGSEGDVWRISAKPSDGAEVLQRVPHERALLDWGGGLVWLLVEPGSDVRACLSGIGGHATRLRARDGSDGIASFPPEPPVIGELARGLRARFDPRGILNPGLMES